jgi:hypothetical protein
MRLLADSSGGLDAVTYFFTSSAVFFLVCAGIFFCFGLGFGKLTWGRYKRRLQKSEESIESYRTEIAGLKRKMAERGGKSAAAAPAVFTPFTPLPAPPAQPPPPASLSPLAALVRGNKPAEPPARPLLSFPPGQGFSIWTEPQPLTTAPLPPSAAFTLWTQKGPPESGGTPRTDTTTMTSTHAGDSGWLYTYEHSAHSPVRLHKSHAHTLWTERSWKPHPPNGPPPPPAAAFSLWTLPDFEPSGKGPRRPAQAFSLWAEPGWSPPRISGLPPRSARSFTLWTEDDFEPSGRGAVPPSRAWSLWTTPDWQAPIVKAAPQATSAAFSLWAEPPHLPPAVGANGSEGKGAGGENGAAPEFDPRRMQGSVFARAFAAARAAFKTG